MNKGSIIVMMLGALALVAGLYKISLRGSLQQTATDVKLFNCDTSIKDPCANVTDVQFQGSFKKGEPLTVTLIGTGLRECNLISIDATVKIYLVVPTTVFQENIAYEFTTQPGVAFNQGLTMIAPIDNPVGHYLDLLRFKLADDTYGLCQAVDFRLV